MLTDRDIHRISELLAKFSKYSQQFEEEEATHDNEQAEKTETLGTVQEGISSTRATNRRTRRAVSQAINKEADKKEQTVI